MALDGPGRRQTLALQRRSYTRRAREQNWTDQDRDRNFQRRYQQNSNAQLLTYLRALALDAARKQSSEAAARAALEEKARQATRIMENQAQLRVKREAEVRQAARERTMRRAQGIRNVLSTDGGSVPKKDNSILARAGRLASSAVRAAPVLGDIVDVGEMALRAAAVPGEELLQTYHASRYSQLRGGSFGDQMFSAALNVPGAGLLPDNWIGERGRELREQSEKVNSAQEREVLRSEGKYASLGEFVTGKADRVLTGRSHAQYLKDYGTDGALGQLTGDSTFASGAVDLIGAIALDPLTYVPMGVAASGLNKPTLTAAQRGVKGLGNTADDLARTWASQASVDAFLTATRRGRAIEQEVVRVAASATDAGDLMRKLPGLAPTVARDIAGASTKEAAEQLTRQALRNLDYVPDISVRRSALLATTGRGLRAPGGLGLGRRVVREAEGLFDVAGKARGLANNARSRIAVTVTSNAAKARRGAVKAALRQAGTRSGDARDLVATAVSTMTPWDRVNQALIDIDSLPAVVADVVEGSLEDLLPKATDPVAFNRAMVNLDAKAQQALLETETLIATARGDFGEEASKQLLVELGVGFTRPGKADLSSLLRRAGNRSGLSVRGAKYKSVTDKNLSSVGKLLDSKVNNPELKAELRGKLATVPKGKKGAYRLNALVRDIRLAADDTVADDAMNMYVRYGDILAKRVDLTGGAYKGLGTRIMPARLLGKVITSLNETVSPSSIRFLSTENAELAIQERVKAFDTYLGALEMDDSARSWFRQAAAEVDTEKDLYRLVEQALDVHANAQGVPGDVLRALLRNFQKDARKLGFKAGQVEGEMVNEVQNLSQLTELVALPSPADIKKTVRGLREGLDDPVKMAELRRVLSEPSDPAKLLRAISWVHSTWKLMVVTNLYMPVVGGFAGFVGEDGSFTDRLKSGFQWAALGALAPTRYIVRIGAEENLRRLLTRGFAPTEFIPGLAKWRATAGVDRPLVSAHLLANNDPTGSWLRYEMMDRTTNEFTAAALPDQDGVLAKLGRKDARYVDGWWRIINYEINDANGALDRILLGVRAGHITRAEADNLFKVWVKTDEGKRWWNRWKSATGAPKNIDEAFQRQLAFIEDYVPADLAKVRLPAMDADFQEVPRSLLKAKARHGNTISPNFRAPAFIHVEKTWTIPRPKTFFKDVGVIKNQLTDKLVFGGPTRAMNRRPLARSIYKEEYTALVKAGVSPERAQQLADRTAINLTNEIMFNQNNESRFAQKVDIVFPFQQPREELVRVWAPLISNNKIRTLQVTALGARALEAGASQGVFYEHTDPYTGKKQWRMKIPGSARLSRLLGGVGAEFDFELRDLLFLTQENMASTVGLPYPGGPFYTVMTRAFVSAFPEHFENLPPLVKKYLFPFGSSGRLGRAEPNRLWMGLMGTPAPWEFANEWEQRDEYRKVQIQMFLHLRYEHFRETGEWYEPSEQEVKEATSAYFKTQAMLGAVWPAASRYIQPWDELVEKSQKAYTDPKTGELDYFSWVNDNPSLAPFFQDRRKYVGPDDLKHWSRDDEARAEDYVKHWSETVSLREFRQEMRDNELTQQAWSERNLIPFQYADHELPEAYMRWEMKWMDKHPEVVQSSRNNYFRDRDLHRILHMAEGAAQDRALDAWRKRYDVKGESFKYHRERILGMKGEWEVDYWRYARTTEEVVTDIRKRSRKTGVDEEVLVRGLQPAEQIKYWKAEQRDLVYFKGEDDPQDILDRYSLFQGYVSDVYRKYPKVVGSSKSKPSVIEKYLDDWRGDYRGAIKSIYDEAWKVDAEFKELQRKGTSWSDYGQALYKKRSNLFQMATDLKNKQFKELPGILEFFDDVMAVTALMQDGKVKGTKAFMSLIMNPLGKGGYIPSNEEQWYLNMPKEVKEAFVQDLVNEIDTPDEKGRLKPWVWLTEFEQDLLRRNFPDEKVKEWMGQEVMTGGGGGRGYGKRGWYSGGRGYYRGGGGNAELQWAYEMFKQYTKRGEGAKAPAAYAEYLKLPANPAVRNQFLDAHPEVGEWIALGPMANMPAHVRFMVQNIMIKNGKWDGEIMSDSEINDLAFADQQLKLWNRRGDMTKPQTYDIWLAMPSGVEKAQYLKAHPEIGDWLRLGPMANMPDAYQDVVRDIMTRYGKWTQATDGLGLVISGYYKTPGHAREQYLEDHPELVAYWNAIRSPEDQKRAAMVDQYFSIQDPTARQTYLIMHPELKDYFVESRTKRYEKFLTQVAVYMGQNPEMFEAYLDRQEDILNDLLLRYAEPPLLRELTPLRDAQTSERARQRG